MPAQNVLILSTRTIFAESLVVLLEEQGYEVIGVQPFDDAALARVAGEQPCVVILDAREAPARAVQSLLECGTDVRVVEVSLDSTTITTYDRREAGATVAEFLRLISASGGQAFGDAGEVSSANATKL